MPQHNTLEQSIKLRTIVATLRARYATVHKRLDHLPSESRSSLAQFTQLIFSRLTVSRDRGMESGTKRLCSTGHVGSCM